MKRDGMSLPEVVVAAAVLLLMVAVTCAAVIGYLRAYRVYSEQGLRLQRASSTLEAVCRKLREAKALRSPVPASLRSANLYFVNNEGRSVELHWSSGKVLAGEQLLGAAEDLQFAVTPGFLQITLPVGSSTPLRTQISLRGIGR